MAMEIRELKTVHFTNTNFRIARVELDCDTTADLPAKDALSGYELSIGSVALIVQTGDFYVLGSDGTWYAADGSGSAASASVNASVQSTRGLTMTESVTPQVETKAASLTDVLLDADTEDPEYVEQTETESVDER